MCFLFAQYWPHPKTPLPPPPAFDACDVRNIKPAAAIRFSLSVVLEVPHDWCIHCTAAVHRMWPGHSVPWSATWLMYPLSCGCPQNVARTQCSLKRHMIDVSTVLPLSTECGQDTTKLKHPENVCVWSDVFVWTVASLCFCSASVLFCFCSVLFCFSLCFCCVFSVLFLFLLYYVAVLFWFHFVSVSVCFVSVWFLFPFCFISVLYLFLFCFWFDCIYIFFCFSSIVFYFVFLCFVSVLIFFLFCFCFSSALIYVFSLFYFRFVSALFLFCVIQFSVQAPSQFNTHTAPISRRTEIEGAGICIFSEWLLNVHKSLRIQDFASKPLSKLAF